MSEPSTNVTETVVTETYYPPERDEPDVTVEVTPDDVVTESELDDYRMAEDERFTAMDGKIDGVTTALGSLAENQTKLMEMFENSKKEPETPKEPTEEKPVDPATNAGPTNQPDHINSTGSPEDAAPTPLSTDPADNATLPSEPVTATLGGDSDKAPKQKLGWRAAVLGGSGGRIKGKSGGNS